ncbi:MAG: peptidase [Acidobacteria bacterium]|nr:peptidase [Acidobacteriota bacterium]MCB9397393.1 peptidase [Acidobacteriota bacterium]
MRFLKLGVWVGLCLVIACQKKVSQTETSAVVPDRVTYHLALQAEASDLFSVRVDLPLLSEADQVFQFCATAPGTYQVMDIGRLVRTFDVYDEKGQLVPVKQQGVNSWLISDPKSARVIRYTIAETFDTELDEHPIYQMAGTSIEKDHAFICAHAVFGFFPNRQTQALDLKLDAPKDWQVGTALTPYETVDNGNRTVRAYTVEDYDTFVDSPILAGTLSVAEEQIGTCQFQVFSYSKSGKVESQAILDAVREDLEGLRAFLKQFPIDHYVFLFHFEDRTVGAWEHSYSSDYVMSEKNFDKSLKERIPDFVNHETFHMVTPLHIRSEKIVPYNFVEPQPTRHIWFFEGVTEWAAQTLQLRGGLVTLEEYLRSMKQKLFYSNFMAKDISLADMGLQSFTPRGQSVFGNFYMKGALNGMLLDILILEKSGGKQGLREVILQLKEKYGPKRVFKEDAFYDELAALTDPAIKTYLETYVDGTEELPIREMMNKVGIDFTLANGFTVLENPTPEQLALREVWLKNL